MIEARDRFSQEPQPQLLDPLSTLSQYKSLVEQAGEGDLVFAQAMTFQLWGEHVTPLIPAWRAAAERGARVILTRDAYTEHFHDYKAHHYFKRKPDKLRELLEQEQDIINGPLGHENIQVVTINKIGPAQPYPMAGRNHSKALGVISQSHPERSVAFLPTFNFFDENIEDHNLAIRFEGKSANTIYKAVQEIHPSDSSHHGHKRRKRDFAYPMGNDIMLYADVGLPARSIAYKESMKLLKDKPVTDILLTTQFAPDPFTLRRLIKIAQEGARVTVITTNKDDPNVKESRLMQALIDRLEQTAQAEPNIHIVYSDGLMHSKILHVTYEDGSTAASTGSNNLFYGGILLGTAELQIISRNQRLNKQLLEHAHEYEPPR